VKMDMEIARSTQRGCPLTFSYRLLDCDKDRDQTS